MSPLAGKRILVTGVATKDSIAWAAADLAQRSGAEVVLTSFGRVRKLTERAAKRLPRTPDVLELDVNRPEDFERLTADLRERWGGVDGALHAVAHAPADALGGRFLDTPPESAEAAFRTSAYSLKSLAVALAPLFPPAGDAAANGAGAGPPRAGGSIVGLTFDASVAWPIYDWMGVSKAALEAVARYLARDLGPRGARVNLVSAGPLETVAAGGIPGFGRLAEHWGRRAPLGWNTGDPAIVAGAICFLLSDWSRGITGEIVHVDGGFHALGTSLDEAPAPPAEPAAAPAPALAGAR